MNITATMIVINTIESYMGIEIGAMILLPYENSCEVKEKKQQHECKPDFSKQEQDRSYRRMC